MNRLPIKFRLPRPRMENDEYQWVPIVRVGRTVPWGYKISEEDPQILLPIPKELNLLEQAKSFLSRYSLRDVSAWLSAESGRSISHVGLMKRLKVERKRTQDFANYITLARQYKEAMRKAKEIEERALGRRITEEEDPLSETSGSSSTGD